MGTSIIEGRKPTGLDRNRMGSLISAFYSGRSEKTVLAYGQDLKDFAEFLKARDVDHAAQILLNQGHGIANETALRYKEYLIKKNLQPSTINRRLASLRSLVKLSRTLGMVPWTLEIQNMRVQSYRDTRGPDEHVYKKMVRILEENPTPKNKRDLAIIRLMGERVFRRGTVVNLDLGDIDLEKGRICVLEKGKREKVWKTMPGSVRDAIAGWIEVRGDEPGPLFTNFDRANKGKRLTGTSVYRLTQKLSEKCGEKTRPHGLRHMGITKALELTNGNYRAVRQFSGHANVQTIVMYDDNRVDLGGEISEMVASSFAVV